MSPTARPSILITSAFLAACGGGGMSTTPPATTESPSSLSMGAGGQLGEYESTIDVEGTTHRYVVHVPASYDPQKGAPLLVHFHGLASSLPYNIKKKLDTLWGPTAEAAGFIAAAPEALPCPQSANDPAPPGCWTPLRDAPFVDAFVDDLVARYNIDRDRIYLSGHSNGAFFVDSIGLQGAARYAAAVEFDGGCSDDDGTYTSCSTLATFAAAAPRKIPYFTIHHPADKNVPSSWTDGFIAMLTEHGFTTKQLDSYDGLDFGSNYHTPDPAVAAPVWDWLKTITLKTAP